MRDKRSALLVILTNNALMTLGFGLWQAIFNNFAVEELNIPCATGGTAMFNIKAGLGHGGKTYWMEGFGLRC